MSIIRGVGLLGVVAGLVACALATPRESQRPNIVWLSVEDMSPWLPCYGDDTVPTPNLDRLAAESIRFTNAFATSPVCAPARSSLITGEYATRIGTMQMRNGKASKTALSKDPDAYRDIPSYEGLPPPFVRCFPETLRAAGYHCTNNRKKDYQFNEPATVWDASGGAAHWRSRAAGQPFFAVFNHTGTHESQAFPESRRRPAAVKPEDVPLPPLYPDTPNVRDAVARTYNNIAAMDRWVGKQLDELEEAGLLSTTIVVFFSDHGVGLPRGKRSCYDTGTRVPLLVRLPGGRGAGTTDDRVVSFVDFGPTTLSLAGLEPDSRLDGTPFLGEHARPTGGLAFSHADRFDSVYDRVRSVSDGRYRYVRNYLLDVPYLIANAYRERLPMTADLYALRARGAARPGQWQIAATTRVPEELYDSEQDPWEVNNLIDEPEHQQRIAALRAALDRWIEDTGDLGFVLPESRLVREKIWPPDGQQPKTPPATARTARMADGVAEVAIECVESGASIGYRSVDQAGGSWTVYTGPFVAAPGEVFELLTHRIGYKPTRVKVTVEAR